MFKEDSKGFRRGDVVLADLGTIENKKTKTSVQLGTRPCIITSNDTGNTYSTIYSVIPLSSADKKLIKKLPTHVEFTTKNSGILMDSISMAEQNTTIDVRQILKKSPLFKVSDEMMLKVDITILIQQGLDKYFSLEKIEMAYAM